MADEWKALFSEQETVRCLLVQKKEHILFEAGDLDELQDVRSITKTILSLVTGIAMERTDRFQLHTPIWEFVEQAPEAMTVRDLLCMKSGFLIEDSQINALLQRSNNWVGEIVRLPVEEHPAFRYKGVDQHLLSAFLTNVLGRPVSEYAKTELFEPLGIESFAWPSDPQGNSIGSTGLRLSARSLAVVGELFRNLGVAKRGRIVSEQWVREATSLQIRTGMSYGDFGYGWWVCDIGGVPAYRAMGAGGNQVVNVPAHDLTIVVTGVPGQHDHEKTHHLLHDVLHTVIKEGSR